MTRTCIYMIKLQRVIHIVQFADFEFRQDYHIGTTWKMSVDIDIRRHPKSVVAYSAEVAHCAVPIW